MNRLILRLHEEQLRKLDILIDAQNRTRSRMVEDAIAEYLNDVADEPVVVDAFTNAYLNDRISFDELVDTVGFDEAKRISEANDR